MRPLYWVTVAAAGSVVAWDNSTTTSPSLLPSTLTPSPTNASSNPDETAPAAPAPTGGAVSQPMKGSMAGLLGFVIVGLAML